MTQQSRAYMEKNSPWSLNVKLAMGTQELQRDLTNDLELTLTFPRPAYFLVCFNRKFLKQKEFMHIIEDFKPKMCINIYLNEYLMTCGYKRYRT